MPHPEKAPLPNSITLLVSQFATALHEKMQAAAIKYGYQADQWLDPDWRVDCIEEMLRHIDKGDPRDVAAYCAFAWYHKWSLTPATTLLHMAERATAAENKLALIRATAAGSAPYCINLGAIDRIMGAPASGSFPPACPACGQPATQCICPPVNINDFRNYPNAPASL